MVYMIWTECMPAAFYKFICKEENFIYFNGKNVLQPEVSEILIFWLKLKKTVCSWEITCLCTRTFSSTSIRMYFLKHIAQQTEEVSISSAHFTLCLKSTRTNRNWTFWKNPQNYENSHVEMCFWQKTNKNWWFQWVLGKRSQRAHWKKKSKKKGGSWKKNKLLKKKEKEREKWAGRDGNVE